MRVMLLGLLAAAVAVGCQVGAQPGRSPATTPSTAKRAEEPKLIGTWEVTHFETGGHALDPVGMWEIGEGDLTMPLVKETKKYTYRLDVSEKPYKIDLGKLYKVDLGERSVDEFRPFLRGICKIEGGVLTVCLGYEARPTKFTTAEEHITVLYKLSPKKPSGDARPATPATRK